MTTLLYFDDPLCLEFTADVRTVSALPDGRLAARLPATWFYPTSGGQEHDTGTIGPAQVVDVIKQGEEVLHVLDRPLEPGMHPARIDRNRRIRAMQHHTAQHLLSAVYLDLLGLASLSANINTFTPSTLDLAAEDLSLPDQARVEARVNELIFENHPVRTYFITDAEVPSIPFRRAPKVTGRIRVVKIAGVDYTPCGGTHCLQTGSIGLLKVLRSEHINHKFRLHFVAGLQALETFTNFQDAVLQASLLLNSNPEKLPAAVSRLTEQAVRMHMELDACKGELQSIEVSRLITSAEKVGRLRRVTHLYRGTSAAELRTLAGSLAAVKDVVAVLASYQDGKLTMIAACSSGCGVDARQLLTRHLAPLGCRGGGDATLAQGGGPVDESALPGLFAETSKWILSPD